MEDLMVPARSLDAVRLADAMLKMSGSFPHGWHTRYTVLNGNFLYIYGSVDDLKPRKVICIDGASVSACEGKHRAHPFAFCVHTRTGKNVVLEPVPPATGTPPGAAPDAVAASAAAYRDKWIKAISNAQYRVMFDRTKAAVAFMEEVKAEVASYKADREGIPVPRSVASGVLTSLGSFSGAAAAAAAAGDDPATVARFMALRDSLNSSDIVTLVRSMRETVQRLSSANAAVQSQLASVRSESALAAARGTGDTASAAENARLRAEVAELVSKNADLTAKMARVSSELADERAARRDAPDAATHEADLKLLAQLREHVETLTAQLEAERREHGRDLERLAAAMNEAAKVASASSGKRTGESTTSLRSAASSGSLTSTAPSAAGAAPPKAPSVAATGRASSTAGSSVMSAGSPSTPPREAGSIVSAVSRMVDGQPVAPSVLGVGARMLATGTPATTGTPAALPSVDERPLESSSRSIPAVADGASEDAYAHEWAPHLIEAQKLEQQGSFADAEQQFAAVLDAKRDRLGDEHVSVAAAHRDLGRVLALEHKYDSAEEQYTRAVDLYSRLLGEAHPNTACALTDLAAVLREQDKFGDAEACAERAVKSLKAGVGAEDVSTATALYNLAGLAKRQGKLPEAEAAYAEALGIFRKKLGDAQGETADTLYQMGCLYRKKGTYMKAGTYFSQAADSYAKTYGPSDKRVAEATKRAHAMAQKIASAAPERPRRTTAAKP